MQSWSRRCGIVHGWFGGLVHRYEPEVKEQRMLKLHGDSSRLMAYSLRLASVGHTAGARH